MITDKKILVVGSGVSGAGAVELLEKAGASPVLYDSNGKLTKEEVRGRLPEGSRAEIILGELPEQVKQETELVVLSPGVPVDLPLVEELRERGARIWGEVELAWHFGKGRVAAITGTNGKTTTTTLVGEILKSWFPEVFVVGNIGTAYTHEALNMTERSVTAAEISSFQLETIETFHPKVSAILNITPDHLDRHHTMDCYIRAKERIAMNQDETDTCVLNYDDEKTRRFGEQVKASVLYFSREHILDQGVFLDGTSIVYQDDAVRTKICDIGELKLLGTHNYENVMAAVAIAAAMGVPLPNIRETVIHFQAVEHRIEFVAEKRGVAWYNDSKGTNTGRLHQGGAGHEPAHGGDRRGLRQACVLRRLDRVFRRKGDLAGAAGPDGGADRGYGKEAWLYEHRIYGEPEGGGAGVCEKGQTRGRGAAVAGLRELGHVR